MVRPCETASAPSFTTSSPAGCTAAVLGDAKQDTDQESNSRNSSFRKLGSVSSSEKCLFEKKNNGSLLQVLGQHPTAPQKGQDQLEKLTFKLIYLTSYYATISASCGQMDVSYLQNMYFCLARF